MASSTPSYQAVLEFLAMAAPTTYAGLTAAYSISSVPPIATHAHPPAIMAKQWLQLYQSAPGWVMPVLQTAVLSNLALAYLSSGAPSPRSAYLIAAALSGTILPLTFVWFEPGINGALKWKVEAVLKKKADEEGGERYNMPQGLGWWRPSAQRHSATAASRRWAEGTDLKELVVGWGRRNQVRWVIAAVAAGVSGWATLGR